ncbi:short-chain dehydrogenase [Gammaproteobacteria bacterium 42_54_T18]|nr:short-chain dehydrogenase [Gammaproteobacteria bacterium 42_54_T18]
MTNKPSWQANAVVTGAGSGIGRAFATELARRNGKVICSDIDLDSAKETVQHIRNQGGHALAVRADVSSLSDVEALATQAEDWFSAPVSLVVNNAGVAAGGQNIGGIPIKDWQWTIDINMWGVIHGCHVFAPKLREHGRGGIINVCSTASFASAPLMGPYNVSKAAVLALSETLAAEMRGTNITVTALCPTFVKTNITKGGGITDESASLADKVMSAIGTSPKKIVIKTINDLDKGKLYTIPQLDAQLIWRAKRILPSLYIHGVGLLNHFATKH